MNMSVAVKDLKKNYKKKLRRKKYERSKRSF